VGKSKVGKGGAGVRNHRDEDPSQGGGGGVGERVYIKDTGGAQRPKKKGGRYNLAA